MNIPIHKTNDYSLGVVILAAGKGTRMRSEKAKVLHHICGNPMLFYTIRLARKVLAEKIVVVVGHQADVVKKHFSNGDLIFAEQREQLGTGHAVMQTREEFKNFTGNILILCGDVPLLSIETVRRLISGHVRANAAVTVLTALMDNPAGYGRIVKTPAGEVVKIVEERDASVEEKKIKEINSGIYCVDSLFLFDAIAEIKNDNAQGEYYLTDIIEIVCKRRRPVRAVLVDDAEEIIGINTPEHLQRAEMRMFEASRQGA